MFNSVANNLVAGDINHESDVFVHDQLTHQTTIVSANADGVASGGTSLAMSSDGRYVAFSTRAAFITGDTNRQPDIYIRDRFKQTTSRFYNVDIDDLSADGRYVSFSTSHGFFPDDTKGTD
ncbi:MAG: hypothetical protein IPN42_12070 [Methylococcaceae bacterium]|nr:hypothetical protein [Methylococcaceae bacterium]